MSPNEQCSAPTMLLCELLSAPETTIITNTQPRFGWVVSDPRRGALQTAYQIVVSSTQDGIKKHEGDLWDTGKVSSSESTNIKYAGRPLLPNTSCWWAVRMWDKDDKPSPYGVPQKINIGKAVPGEAFYSDKWVDPVPFALAEKVHENRHPLEQHTIAPVQVKKKGQGHYFIDFGRAAFGTIVLTITSELDGHEVEIKIGEMRGAGDTVETEPGGCIEYRQLSIRLNKGTHTYKLEIPPKTVGIRIPEHIGEVAPFRYCEVINSPSSIGRKDISQLAVFYRFDDNASSFKSSDSVLNDVWELCKYSIKATSFLGIYVDGQRERLPYEADAYINQLGHYYADKEYALARYTSEHLITHPTWPTEWILHSVLIAWADYMYTGNLDSITRCYNDLKAKTLISLEREDGLISTRTALMTRAVLDSVHYKGEALRDVVDWPQPSESDGYAFTEINTVVNAFHYRALVLMGLIAEAIGRHDDAAQFAGRAKSVYTAFNAELFDSSKGVYRDGEGTDHVSLHANMFALALGLVDEKRKQSAANYIKSRGMACSVYGAQFLLEALYESDEADAALQLMTARNDRSWPHMIYDIGSTVTLEAWDRKYKGNLDWNHAWGAAPANIIPRLLVGIEPLEPGFKVARIRPQISSLGSVSAQVPTIRGPISISINNEGGIYRLQCSIPANMKAELHLPASGQLQVTESGVYANRAEGVSYLRQENGRAVFSICSGKYDFSVDSQCC